MAFLGRVVILVALWFATRFRSRFLSRAADRVSRLSWQTRIDLCWRLMRDDRVPAWSRGLALLPALYLLLPLDLLPDFIPLAGRLDDALAFGIAFDFLARTVPPAVLQEHLREVGITISASAP